MKARFFVRMIASVLSCAALLHHLSAQAAPGYMGFLNTPTTVRAGDASSYMRASLDWNQATVSPTGVALPTILQASTITTSRSGTVLSLRFEIPDTTRSKSDGTALACGDQVVVQIGRVANTATPTLTVGQQFRFEVAIKGSGSSVVLNKRLPRPAGHPLGNGWNALAETSTSATVTASVAGSIYTIDLTIPLSEVGTPSSDIGLALAIINDLGHAVVPSQNEASGTAFPLGVGLTPESDPFFTCGTITAPSGETATGNWINPSTWGVGYFNVASVPLDVTLDQGPSFYLSRAIRLGRCSVLNFSDIAEVTTANWAAEQQNVANNWYLYNPSGSCRMTIWVNATVTGEAGVITKRFLAVWGRPGISPQDWYVAGLSDPVAVTQPTTAISFIWNSPPPVAFTDHPCMRVYVLPEVLPAAVQTAITNLTASPSNANLAAFEMAASVAQGSSRSAQMNFANIGTGSCTEEACKAVVIGFDGSALNLAEGFSLIGTAQAQDDRQPKANLVRVIAHGFGVAAPRVNKPYVYVESLGGLGWAIPATRLAAGAVTLNFEVANPAFTEKMFVGGKPVIVGSPERRIFVAPVISVLEGTKPPTLDLSPLKQFGETPLKAGQVVKVEVQLKPDTSLPFKWWWLLILLLILMLVVFALRWRSNP